MSACESLSECACFRTPPAADHSSEPRIEKHENGVVTTAARGIVSEMKCIKWNLGYK